MAAQKEETVRLFTECIKDMSNNFSRRRTEMEASFRNYEQEDMDLSKLDKLRDYLTEFEKMVQSTKETIDRHCISQLRRSRSGRENIGEFKAVRNDSGIVSGGESFIAQESEESVNREKRHGVVIRSSLARDAQMPEQVTESGASSTDQTNEEVIDESR